MSDIAELINKYGFPIIAAGGMGYLIFYVWKWSNATLFSAVGGQQKSLFC
jgi:hypothetical protein